MPKKTALLLVIIMLLTSMFACDGSAEVAPTSSNTPYVKDQTLVNVVPRGDRLLEIDITDAENGDYDQSISLVKGVGADSVSLSVFWDEIETSPGRFAPDPNWLEISNLYYPEQDLHISLVISVLDTTAVRLPTDLVGKSFTDPEVINRFRVLLDYIKSQVPDLKLTSLAIGNEIDGVLGNNSKDWEDYRTFFTPAAEYARVLWPGVPVGSKIMFDGLIGSSSDSARKLNQDTDVIMVTYYPLAGDFTVKDPDSVREDFDQITSMNPEKEIHITEIGYPTSETNDSSPEKQAAFIKNMFSAWDEHASQITVLSFVWLTDLPLTSVTEYEEYYGFDDPAFAEFLRTLGLRTYPGSGENKIGFDVFQTEAKLRGW